MTAAQKVPRRDEIPVEYTWDLTLMYPDDAAWEQDVAQLEAMILESATLQGTIGQGPRALLRALKLRDDVGLRLYQIYRYASQR
ncbi:MAG: oligoendopeptidase F, partial [Roseiflexaceae bacterium]